MTRILIADDHAIVRRGLKELLQEELPEAQLAFSTTIPETMEQLRIGSWELLLLDIFMPGGNGFMVLKEIRLNHSEVPVLVISSAPEEEVGLLALRAGASGYLDKLAPSEKLVQAVRQILGGGTFLNASLAQQLGDQAFRRPEARLENLSKREIQVLHLVVKGQSVKEIAAALLLSVKTIRTFRARILEKLHVQSDVELVHYALARGLIETHTLPQVPPL
jgi:two-component system, NarL family, invasion response regulator UvrY